MRYLVQSNSESDWQLPGAGEWEGRGDRELVYMETDCQFKKVKNSRDE